MDTPSTPFDRIKQRGDADRNAAASNKLEQEQNKAKELLGKLVQQDQYVGETLRMDFRNVVIQVNDHQRMTVAGIPHLSYLVASRLQTWKKPIEWKQEDSSVLLLRVLGAAPMPSDMMDNIVRSETARRAIGSDSSHWDAKDFMDGYTRYQLSFAGLACEVVGTFYLGQGEEEGADAPLKLRFGTDINNFYPNRGLKVYKPVGEALETIVNFRDPDLTPDHALKNYTVPVGHVRYASTNRPMQGVDEVGVAIAPVDMLAQRTALFGMSRTGKSNTTKIIARAIYNLRRAADNPVPVGQLIFDYNGEYANENTQGGGNIKANALKNVWREQGGQTNDVVTYGLSKPEKEVPGDTRRLLRINVFGNQVSASDWNDRAKIVDAMDMLVVSKGILGDLLSEDSAKYIANFCEVDLSVPDNLTGGKQTRYRRTILAYRALLHKANLEVPASLAKPEIKGLGGHSLFGTKLLAAMRNPKEKDAVIKASYAAAADVFDAEKENELVTAADGTKSHNLNWDTLSGAFKTLEYFIRKDGAYKEFNADHIKDEKSGDWADQNLARILEMFRYQNGARSVARLAAYHEPDNSDDFAQQIYKELKKGNLVIVDQAGGEPSMNDAAARRIMWTVFKGNQHDFINGRQAPDILIYVEEAHNLLPPSKSEDTKDIWVRTAKEGSKYAIGLVYATQEVSSIQKNILKNTANWFIAHLNNTDETKELRKFYDFANFEDSILRAQNRGFLRVKMLSNPYINPVQIQRFALDLPVAPAVAADTAPTPSPSADAIQ